MSDTLTQKQIENWRSVLLGLIGPYALMLSDAEVQAFRDRFQARADAMRVDGGKKSERDC